MTPTRPYLIRALYEWIEDNSMTPHLLVNAEAPGVSVPKQHVRDGQIVLNINAAAVRDLRGGASAFIKGAQEELIDILSGVAAALDYPEEISQEEAAGDLLPRVRRLAERLLSACDERAARILDQGLEVVIVGNESQPTLKMRGNGGLPLAAIYGRESGSLRV